MSELSCSESMVDGTIEVDSARQRLLSMETEYQDLQTLASRATSMPVRKVKIWRVSGEHSEAGRRGSSSENDQLICAEGIPFL